MQRLRVVKDQVGHEDLNGNAKHRKRRQNRVQKLVPAHDRRPEAIKNIAEIILVLLRRYRHVPDQEDTQHANGQHQRADDGKDGCPALRQIQIERQKAAENHQNGQQRHHGVDALGGAPVGLVGGVRQPGIEAGVVGRGAEKGHDAVHDNDQRHSHGSRRNRRRKQGVDHVGADQGKAPNADTPENVAAADEQLALAQLVGKRTDEQGRHRRRHGAGCHHGGDGRRAGVEHLVDEYVKVHILHHPGDLPHQAEHRQRRPESAG